MLYVVLCGFIKDDLDTKRFKALSVFLTAYAFYIQMIDDNAHRHERDAAIKGEPLF